MIGFVGRLTIALLVGGIVLLLAFGLAAAYDRLIGCDRTGLAFVARCPRGS